MTDRWKEAAEKYEEPLHLLHDEAAWYTKEQLKEAFQAGAAHGYEVGRAEALEEAAKAVIVGAGGFDMSYLECVEQIRALHSQSAELPKTQSSETGVKE